MEWSIEQARQDLVDNVFRDCELYAAKELYRRLPRNYYEWEEIKTEIKIYTLEAINLYNPNFISKKTGRKANFKTFLTKHLKLRSCEFYRFAHFRKRYPQGKKVLSNIELESFDDDQVSADDFESVHEGLSPKSQKVLAGLKEMISTNLIKRLNGKGKYKRIKTLSKLTGVNIKSIVGLMDELKGSARKDNWERLGLYQEVEVIK